MLFFSTYSLLTFGQDSTRTEKSFRIIPLVTSSPLMGLGAGLAVSYLYKTDSTNSLKSQLQVGGQYSNTNSYNTFLKNNAWFKNNDFFSTTVIIQSSINNGFYSDEEDVAYNINSLLMSENLIFRVAPKIYSGALISYQRVYYNANNIAGEDFINKNGIQNETTGTFGVSSSYETRKNKYYPSNATWASIKLNTTPEWLGAINTYYSLTIDARYYAKGFSINDVWAWQVFGQYSSKKNI